MILSFLIDDVWMETWDLYLTGCIKGNDLAIRSIRLALKMGKNIAFYGWCNCFVYWKRITVYVCTCICLCVCPFMCIHTKKWCWRIFLVCLWLVSICRFPVFTTALVGTTGCGQQMVIYLFFFSHLMNQSVHIRCPEAVLWLVEWYEI